MEVSTDLRNLDRPIETSPVRSPRRHGYIPKSCSTNGIPKVSSLTGSKSLLIHGTLEFNVLDMSVDDGENRPLDRGTRSMRFVSAASNLVDLFGSLRGTPVLATELQTSPVSRPFGENISRRKPEPLILREKKYASLKEESSVFEIEPLTPLAANVGLGSDPQKSLTSTVPGLNSNRGAILNIPARQTVRQSSMSDTVAISTSHKKEDRANKEKRKAERGPTELLWLHTTDVTPEQSREGKYTQAASVSANVDEITPSANSLSFPPVRAPIREMQGKGHTPNSSSEKCPAEKTSSIGRLPTKTSLLERIHFVKRMSSRGDTRESIQRVASEGPHDKSHNENIVLVKQKSSPERQRGNAIESDDGNVAGRPVGSATFVAQKSSPEYQGAKDRTEDIENRRKARLDKIPFVKKLSAREEYGSGVPKDGSPMKKRSMLEKIPLMKQLSPREYHAKEMPRQRRGNEAATLVFTKIPLINKLSPRSRSSNTPPERGEQSSPLQKEELTQAPQESRRGAPRSKSSLEPEEQRPVASQLKTASDRVDSTKSHIRTDKPTSFKDLFGVTGKPMERQEIPKSTAKEARPEPTPQPSQNERVLEGHEETRWQLWKTQIVSFLGRFVD